jgi:hypothetical protein
VAERERRGEATEEQREAERNALLSLAVFSYPTRDRLRPAVERLSNDPLMDPEQALGTLADATVERRRAAPRLLVLNTLIKLAQRDGRDLFAREGGNMTRLLEALVARSDRPSDVAPRAAAEHLRSTFLHAADGDLGDPLIARDHLLAELDATLGLTDAERFGPHCDDRVGIDIGDGVLATEVAVEFWTDRTVAEMAAWADPRNWPHCSLYFESMDPTGPLTQVPGPPPGWTGEFMEVVTGFPGKKLETPLRFSYTADIAEDDVICSYDLVQPTADIDFDRGNLWARVEPGGPPGRPTRVSSTKLIHFTDPDMQEGASLACDTFWTELAITMALTCSSTGHPDEPADPPGIIDTTVTPVGAEGEGPVPEDKKSQQDAKQKETASDLDLLFKQVLTEATASVQRYTELAANAAKRLAAGNVEVSDWSKDISAASANYVNDLTNAFANWTKAMQIIGGQAPDDKQKKDP